MTDGLCSEAHRASCHEELDKRLQRPARVTQCFVTLGLSQERLSSSLVTTELLKWLLPLKVDLLQS